jgi:hypothetical protein
MNSLSCSLGKDWPLLVERLGSLPKWPWRCSGPGGSAACSGRGRPQRLLCSVTGVCACAWLNHPAGDCAARSGCHKLRTVPTATLQRRPAGVRPRHGWQPRGLHDARPCLEPDGGHSSPAPGAAVHRGATWAPPVRQKIESASSAKIEIAKIESASSAICPATVQPCSRSVAPAAEGQVCSKMAFPRQLAHMPAHASSESVDIPNMPYQKARQHTPRARWRPAGRARAAPATPRGPTAGTPVWGTAARRGCPSRPAP